MYIEEYFKEALRVMLSFPRTDRGTPDVIIKNVGNEISTSDLRKSYPKAVGIKVTKDGILEEITSCFEKRKDNGKVGQQIDCPSYVMNGFRNNICVNSKKGKLCRESIKLPKLNQCDFSMKDEDNIESS